MNFHDAFFQQIPSVPHMELPLYNSYTIWYFYPWIRQSSCGKLQEAYYSWHNLSKHNLSWIVGDNPILSVAWENECLRFC